MGLLHPSTIPPVEPEQLPEKGAPSETAPARLGKPTLVNGKREASWTRIPRNHVGIDVSKARLEVAMLPSKKTFALDNGGAGI